MKSQPVKSPLTISPERCWTCRVPQSPSVWVQRHTQSRRRYSLNAPSQGGGTPAKEETKAAGAGAGARATAGNADLQLYMPTETASSPLLHKTHPHEKKIRYPQLCMQPGVWFLHLLWKRNVDKSQVFSSQVESEYSHRAQWIGLIAFL